MALGRRSLTAAARSLAVVRSVGSSRSLRVVVGAVASSLGAVAFARRSRRRRPRRHAGAPGAGLVVPPRSRRRGARPPLFRGGGSLFRRRTAQRLALSACGRWRCRFLSGGGRGRARRSGRRCLRYRAGVLTPAQSCRRARGGVKLGRHSSVAAAHSLAAVRTAQQLALCACGRWRGRFLSGGGRRRAALTAPPPSAPRWRSWCRLGRAAALAASWRSAPTLLGGGSFSRRGAQCSATRGLCVWSLALSPASGGGRCHAVLTAPPPAARNVSAALAAASLGRRTRDVTVTTAPG